MSRIYSFANCTLNSYSICARRTCLGISKRIVIVSLAKRKKIRLYLLNG